MDSLGVADFRYRNPQPDVKVATHMGTSVSHPA